MGTPAFHRFRGLRANLANSAKGYQWLKQFLAAKGLQELLNALSAAIRTAVVTANMWVISAAVRCIDVVLEHSDETVYYLLDNERAVEKIVCHLMGKSIVKLQVWRILTTLAESGTAGRPSRQIDYINSQ